MANTKSAERRARSSLQRRQHNRSIKSRILTLEQRYLSTLAAGKKDEAAAELNTVSSALDKAAKAGVIPKARASRKKSRLASSLNRLAAQPAA